MVCQHSHPVGQDLDEASRNGKPEVLSLGLVEEFSGPQEVQHGDVLWPDADIAFVCPVGDLVCLTGEKRSRWGDDFEVEGHACSLAIRSAFSRAASIVPTM